MYGTFSLSLVVDVHSNRILSASGNMVMQNTNDFLAHLLIGKNIVTQMDEMCDVLKKRFLALAQKAVIVALRDAQNHYLMAIPPPGRIPPEFKSQRKQHNDPRGSEVPYKIGFSVSP